MAGNLCAFKKCSNSRNKVKGLKMFIFPQDDDTAKIWAKNSGNPDLAALSPTSLRKHRLCEQHFARENILPSGRLMKGALPRIYTSTDSDAGPSTASTTSSTPPPPHIQQPSISPKKFYGKKVIDAQSASPSPHVNKSMSPKRYASKKLIDAEIPSPTVSTSSANFSIEMSPSVRHWIDCASPASPARGQDVRRALFHTPLRVQRKDNIEKLLARQRSEIARLKKQLVKEKLKKTVSTSYNFKTKKAEILFGMQRRRGRRPWTKEEKKLAIGIFLKSPATYRYFLEFIVLPAESTIRMWLASKKCHSTGFNAKLFEKIKMKVETMTEMEKACVVMFDDMSIKHCLEYSTIYDLIEGFQDLGNLGRSNKIAKQATVFMIRGLYFQWKLPIGYFVSEKGLSGNDSKTCIQECINKLQNVGLSVKAIVCDQSTTNTRAFRELGVSVDKSYFLSEHGEKIFSIYDPPHLLKSLRNNLLTHDFIHGEKKISFGDVIKLFEIESQSGSTRAAHQLSVAHISPNNFQKMSVSLAAQIFSHTTAAAMKTAVATGQLSSATALDTAEFLTKINSVFDAMNSRSLFSKNPDRCALSTENQHIIENLQSAVQMFSKLKKINAKVSRPPCFDGFVITINAMLELLQSEKCRFILTSRLNQDPLENLFSSVRQRGGFNRNPTVRTLRSTLKILTIQQILEPPKSTSYDPDFDKLLEFDETSNQAPPSPLESEQSYCSITSDSLASDNSSVDYPNTITEVVTLEECSQVYFVGYLVMKYHKKFLCSDCLKLMSNSECTLTSRKELLIFNRTFTNIKIDANTGLISPSETILGLCQVAFKVFKKKFPKISHEKKILEILLSKTQKKANFSTTVCKECENNSKFIPKLLLKILLHKQCKWISSNLKGYSTEKLKILKHV